MSKHKRKYETWYQSMSWGGKRFIDLTKPKNLARLTQKELYYLDYQQRVYKYDFFATVDAYKHEWGKEFKSNARQHLYNILTGERYRHSLDIFGDNFETAVRYNGYDKLASLFKNIWDKLSYEERDAMGSQDLPNIPIFYRVKLMADSDTKSNQASPTSITSSMKELYRLLIKTAEDKGLIEVAKNGHITVKTDDEKFIKALAGAIKENPDK